jgi:hypothetical protein
MMMRRSISVCLKMYEFKLKINVHFFKLQKTKTNKIFNQ